METEDKQFSGAIEVAEVNGPDTKAENDFGAVQVSAVAHSTSAQGRKLQYSFPPHSYTMLKAKLV